MSTSFNSHCSVRASGAGSTAKHSNILAWYNCLPSRSSWTSSSSSTGCWHSKVPAWATKAADAPHPDARPVRVCAPRSAGVPADHAGRQRGGEWLLSYQSQANDLIVVLFNRLASQRVVLINECFHVQFMSAFTLCCCLCTANTHMLCSLRFACKYIFV